MNQPSSDEELIVQELQRQVADLQYKLRGSLELNDILSYQLSKKRQQEFETTLAKDLAIERLKVWLSSIPILELKPEVTRGWSVFQWQGCMDMSKAAIQRHINMALSAPVPRVEDVLLVAAQAIDYIESTGDLKALTASVMEVSSESRELLRGILKESRKRESNEQSKSD
jgi:hypothetical protein